MRETENKKRTLEEKLDLLREECAKMKAAGRYNYLLGYILLFWFLRVNLRN